MKNSIYTIGHSNHSIEKFLSLIKKYNIDTILDVRSSPHSKYNPQFNRESLFSVLKQNEIKYIFMGKQLGARRNDESIVNKEGFLDYEKVAKSIVFQSGIQRILTGLEKNYTLALMCSEQDPIDCHRSILIARNIFKKGIKINNILTDGNTESQESLEQRLLEKYFKTSDNPLFEIMESSEKLINEAYKLRNRDIAFKKKEE